MYLQETLYVDAMQREMAQWSHKAAEGWRFRDLKSREHKALTAILVAVVAPIFPR
jgi:hypothetical protein